MRHSGGRGDRLAQAAGVDALVARATEEAAERVARASAAFEQAITTDGEPAVETPPPAAVGPASGNGQRASPDGAASGEGHVAPPAPASSDALAFDNLAHRLTRVEVRMAELVEVARRLEESEPAAVDRVGEAASRLAAALVEHDETIDHLVHRLERLEANVGELARVLATDESVPPTPAPAATPESETHPNAHDRLYGAGPL
ncbi:MAG: hypothetical protein ACRD29_09235 [Acidimicrobiales bacterium]